MEVSFHGINNLQIARSRQAKRCLALYPSIHGEVKQGEVAIREYKLRMNLTNDYLGNDYDDFLMSMSKAGKGLNVSYLNNPNKIEILLTKHDVLDDDIFKDYYFSTFKINGENVNLTNRKGLKLYTHLAKLTRELKKRFSLSEEQTNIVNIVNRAIQTEAERFIDLM